MAFELPDLIGRSTGYSGLSIVKAVDITAECPKMSGTEGRAQLHYSRNQSSRRLWVQIHKLQPGQKVGLSILYTIGSDTRCGIKQESPDNEYITNFDTFTEAFGLTQAELVELIFLHAPPSSEEMEVDTLKDGWKQTVPD